MGIIYGPPDCCCAPAECGPNPPPDFLYADISSSNCALLDGLVVTLELISWTSNSRVWYGQADLADCPCGRVTLSVSCNAGVWGVSLGFSPNGDPEIPEDACETGQVLGGTTNTTVNSVNPIDITYTDGRYSSFGGSVSGPCCVGTPAIDINIHIAA